jgi:hypothetical protein
VRRASLLLLAAQLLAVPGPASAQTERQVLMVTTDGISFTDVLAHPEVGSVARAGGVGLLAGRPLDPLGSRGRDAIVEVGLEELGTAVSSSAAGEVLVVVLGDVEDGPRWLALARGAPEEVVSGTGRAEGLTSDTTRIDGLVAGVDVTATVVDFLGLSGDVVGSAIRIEGEVPSDLYERAVEYRRVATPIGAVVLALSLGALVVGVGLLLAVPGAWLMRHSVALLGLFGMALTVALVPASALPSLHPGVVVPALLLFAAILLAAALVVGRRDPAAVVAVVAGTGLAVLVVDGLLGWPTEVTPLLGGGALLGVRFYGLGNSAAGIVLAGGVLVAARLRLWPGVMLLAGAALFAGLPFLGSDLGGGVTLFAVAGLWYGWRARGRFDAVTVAAGLGAALAGGALLVAAHALWPVTTHIARAVEGSGAGLVQAFADRLASNIRATSAIWPAWLTVIGLPVWIAVAARAAGPFREALARRPEWRLGVIVLAIGGIIGYVLNDTYGMAAVAFAFVSAAMLYPALRGRWTIG